MNHINPPILLFVVSLSACNQAKPTLEEKVNTLVNRMVVKHTQRQACADLEALGDQAVPYIVKHLNDFRPLPSRAITLTNQAPDAFEATRHYGPEVVHDALSAILNQITGAHFEFVYNGATQPKRTRNSKLWADWCSKRYPRQ